MSVAERQRAAAIDMRDVVIPRLAPYLGIVRALSLELEPDQGLATDMDREAGIDWYFHRADGTRQGVASRVQWVGARPPYDTFTLRVVTTGGSLWTELPKRITAERLNGMNPNLQVHAYLDEHGGRLCSAGVVVARVLYEYALARGEQAHTQITWNDDGSAFIHVHFCEVPGVYLIEHRPRLRRADLPHQYERERLL